jgi:hypothetical protein
MSSVQRLTNISRRYKDRTRAFFSVITRYIDTLWETHVKPIDT